MWAPIVRYDIPQTMEAIFSRMGKGESLRAICRSEGMPSTSAVMEWLNADDKLAEQYARAMIMRADAKFDELDDVAEDAVVAESSVQVAGLRLKADNIKWQLARMNPKKYGDRIEQTVTGADGGPLSVLLTQLGKASLPVVPDDE